MMAYGGRVQGAMSLISLWRALGVHGKVLSSIEGDGWTIRTTLTQMTPLDPA